MIIEITANNDTLEKHKIPVKNGEKANVTHFFSSGLIDIKILSDGYEVFNIPIGFTNYEKVYKDSFLNKNNLRNK